VAKPRKVTDAACSFRVTFVVLLVLIIFCCAVVLIVFLVVWLFSNEYIGGDRATRTVGVEVFWTYFAHAQWYASRLCSHTDNEQPAVREELMRQIAEFIAVLSCSLFTGAAVYITFIEHPARMQCGVEIAVAEFAPSYRRATVMQATCAAGGLLSSVAAWLDGASFSWLVAGVLLGSVIPFTLIAILPTNKRLLSPTLDRRSVEAERLLALWGRLHSVRSVLSGTALLLFLYLLVFSKTR
jgi:hypothetical protein